MIDVYVLRHGEPVGQGSGRFLGQRDVPLTEQGFIQAQEWREALGQIPFALAVSSDLSRCVQTADAALAGRPVPRLRDARLRELCLGQWEGLTVSEIEERFPGAYLKRGASIAVYTPPGGESFVGMNRRVLSAMSHYCLEALNRRGPLLVVAHLGVARCLLCHALRVPLKNMFSLSLDYARCARLTFDGRFRAVTGLNLAPGSL